MTAGKTLDQFLTLDGLAAVNGAPLIAFLAKQRWFGSKAEIDDARFVDVVPLPWDDRALAIGIVEVKSGDRLSMYQLPLAVRPIDPKSLEGSTALIAPLKGAGAVSLLDAMQDPVFQSRLGGGLVSPESFRSEHGGTWSIERLSKAPLAITDATKVVAGSAEQSNSALIFGELAILKLFRKLERGVQPDVELTRFLSADAGFPHVAPLFATLHYRDTQGEAVAGMLQEYLPGSRDAWSYFLAGGKDGRAAALATTDVEHLGRISRELHESLAGTAARGQKDFEPIPAKAVDVERWAQRTKESIRSALALLDKQRTAKALAPERAAEAEALEGRRDHYLAWVEEIADLIGDDGGSKIRVHGDYHLGQVLRTKSDSFVIIDFEGEPTRALADRREKTSPLKDVAGMLRSFGYAGATLSKPAKSDRRTLAERELVSGRWERDARAAFLRGYTGAKSDDQHLLPGDPRKLDALLSLFEAEKAFYELAYELNHRPGWEWIPMRGIARLLAR